MSKFSELLKSGRKVLTAELPTINSCVLSHVRDVIQPFIDTADAVNVADNPAARAHVSPIVIAGYVHEWGGEPIMHMACRDRNRLALQSELLGAALMGVENILCLTGDDVTAGDEPESKRVFDLDSPQLIKVARTLSDGHYLSGRILESETEFYIGAAESPTAPPYQYRADRALKKAEAGAQFFQLQISFEFERLKNFLVEAELNGLISRASILPSVCITGSARGLKYMRDHVPGVFVPEQLIEQVDALPRSEQPAACREFALKLASQILALPNISGLHVISFQGAEPLSDFRELLINSNA